MSTLAEWAEAIRKTFELGDLAEQNAKERGSQKMAVKAKGKPGRKPGTVSSKQAYSVAGLLEVLNTGTQAARLDAIKRYPATSLAMLTDAGAVISSLTKISARQVESALKEGVSSNGSAPEATVEAPAKKKKVRQEEPPKAKKKVKKAAPVVSDEDDNEDDEEEAPVKRGPGRPKGSGKKAAPAKAKAKPAAKKKSKRAADEDDDDNEIDDLLGSADDEDEEDEDDEDSDEDEDTEDDDEEEEDDDEEDEDDE